MTQPKPKHLQTKYAEQFQDEAVVNAYHNRPAYADDEAVQKLVWAHVGEETLETAMATCITWGFPQKAT